MCFPAAVLISSLGVFFLFFFPGDPNWGRRGGSLSGHSVSRAPRLRRVHAARVPLLGRLACKAVQREPPIAFTRAAVALLNAEIRKKK